jgi:hypothetical protein
VGEVPSLTALSDRYQSQGFEFYLVYTREAHPGEGFPHHASWEQKRAHAINLREQEKVRLPILIDDLAGTVHRAYGQLSNMIYLIDRDGTIVYKSDWTNADDLDGMCRSLIRLDGMKAAGASIVRKGTSERVHWMSMDPVLRERVYRRAGEKAIRDYFNAMGRMPYATDTERK